MGFDDPVNPLDVVLDGEGTQLEYGTAQYDAFAREATSQTLEQLRQAPAAS